MYKPYITKGWEKLTFIAETFHEEISNALHISVKIPAKARIIFIYRLCCSSFPLLANDNIPAICYDALILTWKRKGCYSKINQFPESEDLKLKAEELTRTISCQGPTVPTVRINSRFPHTVTYTHMKQGKDTGLQFGGQFLLFSLSSYSSHQLCSLEPLVNWESWRQKQTSDSEEKVWGLMNVMVILSLLPIS